MNFESLVSILFCGMLCIGIAVLTYWLWTDEDLGDMD